MKNLFKISVGHMYKNNLSGAFNLIVIAIFFAYASYHFEQLYAYTFSLIVIAIVRKHMLEYVEQNYVKKDE